MEHDDPFRPEEPASSVQSSVLPILSLALGIMSVPGALFLGLGILPGLVGLVLGIVAGRRAKWGSGLAAIGIALSLMGTIMSGAVIALIVWSVYQVPAMAGRIGDEQLKMNQAWEGVLAPDASLVGSDGTDYPIRERADRKLILYQYFPVAIPLMSDASNDVAVVNRLAESAGSEYDMLVLVPMNPSEVQSIARDQGSAQVTAPMANSQLLPPPFAFAGFAASYFVIDRNGVIQYVFGEEATYDEIVEAAIGPDFEGEPASEPDFSDVDAVFEFSTTQGSVGVLP